MRGLFAQEDGFAMLELRVVLALIGLVLLVPITSFAAMRQGASGTTARSDLRAAVAQAELHHLQHGTYAGLTPAALDSRHPKTPRYTVTNLSETTYCIAATVGGRSWKTSGPAGRVVEGDCSS
jgi:Tfp pilus assembly protein PilE